MTDKFMSVRVKICGITNADDAQAAIDAGADALGFVFFESSPRYLSLAAAAAIIRTLPPFISKVGVFVDPGEEFVRQAMMECGIDAFQFHGSETPEFCARFPGRAVKAFRVRDEAFLEQAKPYVHDAWLLDSYVSGQSGGTGVLFNWNLARLAVDAGARVILAGGLTPENVAEAVRQVAPYGVDVSSGVESTPGRKDHAKVRAFIREAKAARRDD
jgi:phosphoribosylanthranilate isomerase